MRWAALIDKLLGAIIRLLKVSKARREAKDEQRAHDEIDRDPGAHFRRKFGKRLRDTRRIDVSGATKPPTEADDRGDRGSWG